MYLCLIGWICGYQNVYLTINELHLGNADYRGYDGGNAGVVTTKRGITQEYIL